MAESSPRELPEFIPPMLAKRVSPFDSEEHFFEIKWDGFRAQALIDGNGFRLLSRNRHEMRGRYPELEFLEGLPRGLALDGELVIFKDDRPSFQELLSREHAAGSGKLRRPSVDRPASFIAFDLMYANYQSCMALPLEQRRELLSSVIEAADHPRLVFSQGVEGAGKAFFAEAQQRGLEGVVAKRLGSPYLSGQRTDAWTKIKKGDHAHCLVLGFLEDGPKDFKSLHLATNTEEGELRYVGRVGGGFPAPIREQLNRLLRENVRSTPLVPCDQEGVWVEPGIYCVVSYLEYTETGMLRAPVFRKLVTE